MLFHVPQTKDRFSIKANAKFHMADSVCILAFWKGARVESLISAAYGLAYGC